jgi:thioredoxin-related protein
MKALILFSIFLLSLSNVMAQEWQTDYTAAREIAIAENKPIILVFQGSDWCAPCMKLDKEIWSAESFKAYAKDHYVMLKADFPKRKANALSDAQSAANGKLAETYNKNGIFPFVVVMDGAGKVLGETGYKKTTPDLYIKELNTFIPVR